MAQTFIFRFTINYINIIKAWTNKLFVNVRRACRESKVFSFLMTLILIPAFCISALTCWVISFSYKSAPRCFWGKERSAGILLNRNWGYWGLEKKFLCLFIFVKTKRNFSFVCPSWKQFFHNRKNGHVICKEFNRWG